MANNSETAFQRRVAQDFQAPRVKGTDAGKVGRGLPDIDHDRLYIRARLDPEKFREITDRYDETARGAWKERKVAVLVLKHTRSGTGKNAGYLLVVHVDDAEAVGRALAEARRGRDGP